MTMNVETETARLSCLKRYEVLDTPAEDSFDRITRMVQSALQVPIALVSLVDENRQWFKSQQGLEAESTPREISFCTHAIKEEEAYVVEDASRSELFRDNPLVTGDPNIRSYAGAQLISPDGHKVGTLCAIDTEPREFSAEQIDLLQDFAKLVVNQLELRTMAAVDGLSGVPNRRFLMRALTSEVSRSARYGCNLSVICFDIDKFKGVNDEYGHAAGDAVIRNTATWCHEALRTSDLLGRTGGEEFTVLLPETGAETALLVAERLRQTVESRATHHVDNSIKVTISLGVAQFQAGDTVESLLERSDQALYAAKDQGRNLVVPCTLISAAA